MSPGEALAEAAASFVGVRFRLHGRDPANGLDCVGLVSAALTAIGRRPLHLNGYGLRNLSVERWFAEAARSDLSFVHGPIMQGDVLLVAPGPIQHHLMIAESSGCVIHAHATFRRVVREPITRIAPTAHWRP